MPQVFKMGWGDDDYADALVPKREVTVSLTSVDDDAIEVDTLEPRVFVYLDIHHLDVGQGECTLIALMARAGEGGEAKCMLSMLIDGGYAREGGGTLLRLLEKLNIKVIDVVAVSHFDKDHFEGLTRLLNQFDRVESHDYGEVVDGEDDLDVGAKDEESVKEDDDKIVVDDTDGIVIDEPPPPEKIVERVFIRTTQPNIKKTTQVTAFFDALKRHNAEPYLVEKGDEIRLDCGALALGREDFFSMKLLCVNSGAGGTSEDDENAHSMAWLLRFGKYTYYTAGDLPSSHKKVSLEDALADDVLKEAGGPLTAIKCGHHGAETSTSAAFLAKVKPSLAFISAGRQDGFSHPRTSTLLNLYGSAGLQATFLTSCMYNRPFISGQYATRALQTLQTGVTRQKGLFERLVVAIPDLTGTESTRKGMDKSYPRLIKELRESLEAVVAKQQEVLNAIAAAPGDSTQYATTVTKLEEAVVAFSDWRELLPAIGALRRGIELANGKSLGPLEVGEQKAQTDRYSTLTAQVALAKELRDAIAVLNAPRDPAPKFIVAGTKKVLGSCVLRFDAVDADKDDRVVFVGYAHEAWSWGYIWYGAKPEGLDLPKDTYWDVVEIERLKEYKVPNSPGTWQNYLDSRTEEMEERKELRDPPPTFDVMPSKKRKAETPPHISIEDGSSMIDTKKLRTDVTPPPTLPTVDDDPVDETVIERTLLETTVDTPYYFGGTGDGLFSTDVGSDELYIEGLHALLDEGMRIPNDTGMRMDVIPKNDFFEDL